MGHWTTLNFAADNWNALDLSLRQLLSAAYLKLNFLFLLLSRIIEFLHCTHTLILCYNAFYVVIYRFFKALISILVTYYFLA